MQKKALVTIILIWLGWFLALYVFQGLVAMRFTVQRPDTALNWTAQYTTVRSQSRSVYLNDPFMNNQVAWDSEYYLGIAVGGYDDPRGETQTDPKTGAITPRNYAFFPLYPYLIKGLAFPLAIFGLDPIAAATLAGIVVSLLGTLAGMLALYDMSRVDFAEEDRLRAVFYLLIFPTGFFLAQVYTEGLFIGLAFGSLALMKRGQWLWAALLAALAALSRAQGAVLVLPLAMTWLQPVIERRFKAGFSWKWVAQGLSLLLPVAAYIAWRISPLGQGWAALEFYFGRGFLDVQGTLASWISAIEYMYLHTPARVYYFLELFIFAIAILASLTLLRRDPRVALFSLAIIFLSFFSGSAISLERYVLVAPATYISLSSLGRFRAFDRAWTIASLLLMGLLVTLFTFKFWAG